MCCLGSFDEIPVIPLTEYFPFGRTTHIPVFYVLEIYQDTFRHEKPVVEIHTAEPLSPISVGDYLYEGSFPDPLAYLGGRSTGCLFRVARNYEIHHKKGEGRILIPIQ